MAEPLALDQLNPLLLDRRLAQGFNDNLRHGKLSLDDAFPSCLQCYPPRLSIQLPSSSRRLAHAKARA